MAQTAAPSSNGLYKDKDHPDQIRQSNITAAKGNILYYVFNKQF